MLLGTYTLEAFKMTFGDLEKILEIFKIVKKKIFFRGSLKNSIGSGWSRIISKTCLLYQLVHRLYRKNTRVCVGLVCVHVRAGFSGVGLEH